MSVLGAAEELAHSIQPMQLSGVVAAVRGMTMLVHELPVPVGSVVRIGDGGPAMRAPAMGEVVGFAPEHAVVMLLDQAGGIRPGDRVVAEQAAPVAAVSVSMLGRMFDGLGRPLDGGGAIRDGSPRPLNPAPLNAMRRRRIDEHLRTGVRAIDLMTPVGRGQRMGIFAGPGVGKSILLGTIARRCAADVSVIALIGERGREVKDFVEHALGPQGLARSVLVVATGDESPLLRIRAAKLACTIAEFFRDQGAAVLLMMDSVTRFAHAQRQVGLSVGEPPATKGYTPSVFAALSLLLERAGAVVGGGSVTGLYTILVEGDDLTEPVADAARGILDGHVILSRKLAQRGHYPAVDVLDSVSRVADDVVSPDHAAARRQAVRMLAIYRDVEDLVQIGAYARGSNPEADVAIESQRGLNELLRQTKDDAQPFDQALATLVRLSRETKDAVARLQKPRNR